MRPRQLMFDVEDKDAEPGPFVYVACRLTSLDAEHRKLLDSWCTHIQHSITDAADDSGDPWRVAVHTPLSWSAPWTDDGRTPQDIYALNRTKVAECAALIVLATNGGGLGVGQEFAWATSLRLPILVLHHTDEPPSRQAVGTPADITVVAFTDATYLTEAVKEFVRRNRSTIADVKRRRDSLMTVLIPLRENLAEVWAGLPDHERSRVEAESRLHRDRVTQLVDDANALAGASMSEILALVGALGLDPSCIASPPTLPDLTARQRSALASAADEHEWGGSEALALETRARLELARGGNRRLPLVTPADWLRFREEAGRE